MAATSGNGVNEAAQPRAMSIRSYMEGDEFRQKLATVLPKHLTAERMQRVAIAALTRQPKLAQCDMASFFGCMMTLSQWGLEPDGRRAHLIPFENRKQGTVECQLIIDYKGLVELVLRSGLVSSIHADVVCDADEFEADRGELVRHRVDYRKPRGEAYAVYCRVKMRDGTETCEVLSRDEVEAVRRRSRASSSGPWVTDWNEMAKKTAFRRCSKWLPLSAEIRDAAERDDDSLEDGSPVTLLAANPRRLNLGDLTDRLIEPAGADPEAPASTPADYVRALAGWLDACATIEDVKAGVEARRSAINGEPWSPEQRLECLDQILRAADARIAEIKA